MRHSRRFRAALPFAAMGLAIGWIAGLSVTPIVATLLASLLGLVGGALGGLLAVTRSPNQETDAGSVAATDPAVAAVLMFFVAVGSTVGLTTRTHRWLEPSTRDQIEEYVAVGLPKNEAVRRVLEARSPSGGPGAELAARQTASVLFGRSQSECDRLAPYPPDESLLKTMELSTESTFKRLAASGDAQCVKRAVEALCAGQ